MATKNKQIATYADEEHLRRIEQMKQWLGFGGTGSQLLLAIIDYAYDKMSEEDRVIVLSSELMIKLMFRINRGEITEAEALAQAGIAQAGRGDQ